jgi:hypothetical protein
MGGIAHQVRENAPRRCCSEPPCRDRATRQAASNRARQGLSSGAGPNTDVMKSTLAFGDSLSMAKSTPLTYPQGCDETNTA